METDIDTAKEMGAMTLFWWKYGKKSVLSLSGLLLLSSVVVLRRQYLKLVSSVVKEQGIGSGTVVSFGSDCKEAFEAYREQEDALKEVVT